MNKFFFLAIMAIGTLSFTSCGTYNSARDSNSAVRSSSLIKKIAPILIRDLGSSVLSKTAASGMMSKLNMGTKLNSIIKGATMLSSFKNMLTSNYGIASNKVDNAYGKLKTLKDVAGFIGTNASPSFLSSLK